MGLTEVKEDLQDNGSNFSGLPKKQSRAHKIHKSDLLNTKFGQSLDTYWPVKFLDSHSMRHDEGGPEKVD